MDHSTGNDEWDEGPTSAHLTAYRDLTPELGRFLADFAGSEVTSYLQRVKQLFPHWYVAFGEGMLGQEHNLSHPIDSFQLFLAESLISEPEPNELVRYVDVPWLERGDLFYLHKLSEVIKRYRGVVWDDSVLLHANPGDRSIQLSWQVFSALPSGVTWRIDYTGPTGDQPSPIVGLPSQTTEYTLSGLTNGVVYEVQVTALAVGQELIRSDRILVVPNPFRYYMPLFFIPKQ
jgi:hypothetical protein